jgi:hypothetical protein
MIGRVVTAGGQSAQHLIVLVRVEEASADPYTVTSVGVVPANASAPLLNVDEVRQVVVRSAIRRQGATYRHAWSPSLDGPEAV